MNQLTLWLQTVSDKDIIEELKRREAADDMFLDKLKKGLRCILCGRWRKRYGYSLTQDLAVILEKIYAWSQKNGLGIEFQHNEQFYPEQIFPNDIKSIKRYHRLADWGFIKKLKSHALWELTPRGIDWVRGEMQVYEKAWVYPDRPVEYSGELISIADVEPNWKFFKQEWCQDYTREPYQIAAMA